MKLKWKYDNTASIIVKWLIQYKDTEQSSFVDHTEEDETKREITLSPLLSGKTYSIKLFAVTTSNTKSQTFANIITTVGK